MKIYLPILILICFSSFSSAQNNFDTQWESIKELESEGLTKSALEQVERLYQNAKNTNNQQQVVKALLYKSKYILILEEDAQLNIINNFKAEIEHTSNVATKHLLENMLATLYWQYFKQNRYRFYNRSTTIQKLSDDFRTWDLETLFHEIHIYFQKSLEDQSVLIEEPLEDYEMLLVEADGSKKFRPTLFDLLAHNALSFYKTDETSITQPRYKFEIDRPMYFSNLVDFSGLDIKTQDSTSLQLHALKIYQKLIGVHLSNPSAYPAVYNDIERLKFIHENTTLSNKDDLLKNALTEAYSTYKTEVYSTYYSYEIAQILKRQGNRYNAQNPETKHHQWQLKKAYELCDSVLESHAESDITEAFKNLQSELLRPYLQVKSEGFLPVNTPSKVLVTYKNLNEITFEIFKVSAAQLRAYFSSYKDDEREEILKGLKAHVKFTRQLKTEGDYQIHSTELVLPNLDNGLYLIKANTTGKVFSIAHIQITDFAISESANAKQHIYQIIDRNNGAPITNASVEVIYETNRSETDSKRFTTNNFGNFEFERDDNYYRNVQIRVNHNNEVAHFGDYYIGKAQVEQRKKKPSYNTYLFADRSIYRPGQTIYFKGICTKTEDNTTSVLENETVSVTLHNTNGEQVKTLDFTTNTYGSFHGEFVLPNSGLTGSFYIETRSEKNNRGYLSFSVEEYKRPTFKPKLSPISITYRVNDSITVNGKAMAFAGSAISNAKVVYRVQRNIQLPKWYYWRRPYVAMEAQEITYGETKTNSKGEFEITFKALPDNSISKADLPIFNYEVTADITDINGETRSTTTVVNVGYHTTTLTIIAPPKIDKLKKRVDIEIVTKNLNNETVTVKGVLNIYKLQAPDRVLRKRPWQAPDYQEITLSEYKTLFPHEAYDNEDVLINWGNGELVYSKPFDTAKDVAMTIKRLKRWTSGAYSIVAVSTDAFGQKVEDKTIVTLYSDQDKTVADQQLFQASLDEDKYQPGDTVILTLASAVKNLTLTVDIEKDKKIISTQLIQLNNSKAEIRIPVLEDDLGGFVVHCSFAAFNRYQRHIITVKVPYPSTELQIETSTFRDQLEPGQEETWSFNIKGPKGDKVTAELLASMYDASLDEFRTHDWSFNPINYYGYYARNSRIFSSSFGIINLRNRYNFKRVGNTNFQEFDQLNWFGFYLGDTRDSWRLKKSAKAYTQNASTLEDSRVEGSRLSQGNGVPTSDSNNEIDSYDDLEEVTFEGYGDDSRLKFTTAVSVVDPTYNSRSIDQLQLRKNLQETAFFYPQLQTDTTGHVRFSFKTPEALTQWKLQLLAHTKTLESSVTQLEAITQKDLMVIPNAPRFLRQNDQITISTKIANLSSKVLSGTAELILEDAITGNTIGQDVIRSSMAKSFSVAGKENTQVSWNLQIPETIQAIQYKIIAKTEQFSDGMQSVLPVLSNRILVTETMPMWVSSNQTKTFTLDKLKNNSSTTLKHHKLTLEITSNPAWYALQALPYLMEYPYECNEQTFSRYYANSLAQYIINSNPQIQQVFNQWKSKGKLISNLEQNQELKNLLIEETPWLREAQSETEQQKRIGLLFDVNRMSNELQNTIQKLSSNQHNSGAWPWFSGGRDNRYITQHIVGGFGHLKQLGVQPDVKASQMTEKAIQYLDDQFLKDYKDLKKHNPDIDLSEDQLSYIQLHYLYVRSFYTNIGASKEVEPVLAYYQNQIKTYWLKRPLYAKGLMALIMHRMDDSKTANRILKSLEENSITSEELGMYWKENTNSWYWHRAPIETQALLIEAFSEIKKDWKLVDNLKIWLLKHKQTNRWKTTKATTEAVYALLLQGTDWLSINDSVTVDIGNETISLQQSDGITPEAGTGYFKTSWHTNDIQSEQAQITLTKQDEGIAWGGLYWQYFEDLDKFTSAETPLKLGKKLFLKSYTDKGEEISEITAQTKLNVGDLVRVRIELRSDRDMEFVHLKDMRASGFEPINVLSQYKWQDGLGYYESTRDASTNFFMDYLPKGIYVFEYDLRVNNSGDMSNGTSTIQSMYAPEFTSHSEGVRVIVD